MGEIIAHEQIERTAMKFMGFDYDKAHNLASAAETLLRKVDREQLPLDKTADQIADAVLEKLAVSRWREAIYSGELPVAAAEQLKKYMGTTPQKEMGGIVRGAENIAKRFGYRINEYSLKNIWDAAKSGKITGAKIREHLPKMMDAIGGGGGVADLTTKEINLAPFVKSVEMAMEVPKKFRTPQVIEEAKVLSRGHEANEILGQKMEKRLGPYVVPSSIAHTFSNSLPLSAFTKRVLPNLPLRDAVRLLGTENLFRSGLHTDPSVILKELRQSRMLSPGTRAAREITRQESGELAHLRKATGTLAGTIPIPKKQLASISKRMRDISTSEFKDIAGQVVQSLNHPELNPELSGIAKYLMKFKGVDTR
jgi:hypothetical protein